MADTDTTDSTDGTEQPPVVEEQEVEETATEESTEETEETGTDLSREDLETELKRVRQEAAQRRIEARELKEQLANAKTPEEFSAVQDKVTQLERQQTVRDVADEYKLPKELREALKGDTEEELKAHAKVLAKFVPAEDDTPPPFLGGGLNPNDSDADDNDPAALAKSLRRKSF